VIATKILVYKSGYIDLEVPVQMTEFQREEFINFFKEIFPDAEIKEVEEPVGSPIGERGEKEWSADEYQLLLDSRYDNKTIASKINRTEMAVRMKRGEFLPDFFVWLKRKGYVSKKIDKKIIEKYLEEKHENIDRR